MQQFTEDLNPDEAKLIALQFLGQNIGELKELDKRIINKTPTLNGLKIDPKKVIDSIPSRTIATKSPTQQLPVQTVSKTVKTVKQLQATASDSDLPILEKIYNKLCDIENLLAIR